MKFVLRINFIEHEGSGITVFFTFLINSKRNFNFIIPEPNGTEWITINCKYFVSAYRFLTYAINNKVILENSINLCLAIIYSL